MCCSERRLRNSEQTRLAAGSLWRTKNPRQRAWSFVAAMVRSRSVGEEGRWKINSLGPGRSECNSKNVISNLVLLIGIFRSSHGNALQWMPQGLTDDKSTLLQVMAWCRQATSHYLSQRWLSSLSPYSVARPQWVNGISWRHQVMEIHPSLLALCEGNPPVTGGFPSQRTNNAKFWCLLWTTNSWVPVNVMNNHFVGLVEDCNTYISSALAMEKSQPLI